MRILVCFKVVDDLEAVLSKDWNATGTDLPDISYVRRTLGCFDEAALENALRLKGAFAALGETPRVTALTAAPGRSEQILQALPAVGVDHVARVECAVDLTFAPQSTAKLLAQYARENGPYDLILAGTQAPPGNSGMVPLYLAELLNIPCVTEAMDFRAEPNALAVEHRVRGGVCTRTVRLPVLCTVGNARHSYLRVATLRDKMRTRNFRPTVQTVSAAVQRTRLTGLERQGQTRAGVRAEGGSETEKARRLYHAFLKEVLSR